MPSKTISLKETTYDRLAREKGDDESFSDAIDRLLDTKTGDHPLYDLIGLCDETDAETPRTRSGAFGNSVDDRMGPRS